MKPCQRCGASGTDPCITRSGHEAKAWHKARTVITRSPRQIEDTFLQAVSSAPWLSAIDSPAIAAAATLARQIDDKVHEAERQEGLFPVAALAEEGGGITYDIATFSQLCDGLGLTPKGRHLLNLDTDQEDTDALAQLIALHND